MTEAELAALREAFMAWNLEKAATERHLHMVEKTIEQFSRELENLERTLGLSPRG